MRRDHIEDPYIEGLFQYRRKTTCQRCGESAFCIYIEEITLPPQIALTSTILHRKTFRQEDPHVHIDLIGVNCGCYAKFHRQMAHIITNMNHKRRQEGKELISTP